MSLTDAKVRIKDVPISMVIGRYLVLHKKGTNYSALCPFHQDTHPSLTVNDQKGLFRCFSCDTGGDVITFVQKYKSLGFKEALIEIYSLLGLPTEELLDSSSKQKDPKWERATNLLLRTAKLYRQAAIRDQKSPYFEFIKQRQLDPQVAEKFMLGFAPKNNLLLLSIEKLKGAQFKELLKLGHELGLIRTGLSNKSGRSLDYDTFRERITFPIWDYFGNVVGFGSRALFSYQRAKYLNIQDSFVFNKKNILYGYHFARSAIREKNQVILVEGYMDAITLHQFGFSQSVAIMGVAISEKSINNLKALTKNIILALDSDTAGMKAMKRINQLFMGHGLLPKYVDFSPAKDPDEFLHQFGEKQFQQKVNEAQCVLDKIVADLIPVSIPEPVDLKLNLLHKLFAEFAPLGESLIVSEKLTLLAKKLELHSSAAQIMEAYRQFLEEGQKRPQAPVLAMTLKKNSPALQNTAKLERPQSPLTQFSSIASKEQFIRHVPTHPPRKEEKITLSKTKVPTFSKAAKAVIAEIIHHPNILGHPKLPKILDLVNQNEIKKLVQVLRIIYFEVDESEYSSIIMDHLLKEEFSLEIREIVGKSLYHGLSSKLDEKGLNKLVLDLETHLQKEILLKRREDLRKRQKECSDEKELLGIIDELTQIARQVQDLKIKNNKH